MQEKEFKYYTCKYDAAFKEVFMDENDISLLKALLEFILKVNISKIEIKNSELNNDNVHVRRKLVDLITYTDQGVFNIEVNSSVDSYLRNRNFSYLANVYSNAVLRGEEYDSNNKYIQINLSYGLTYKDAFRKYMLADDNNHNLIDNFIIYEFNMDYYLNFWYNKNESEIEKNKYLIMLNLDKKDLETLSKKDKVVSSYMSKLNNINEDPRFQSYMSAEEDDRKIRNTLINRAERKGREEGLKEGLKEGREEGFQEANIETARKMVNENISVDVIAKCTGLSKEEILKL